MNRATWTCALALSLLGACLASDARADLVHLKNGRTLEGKVVSKTATHVRLRVAGGQLSLPRQSVAKIETRRPASEDYVERARATDMEDPRALSELADWASTRGLGAQARQLRDLARGLQLEQRIARAKQGSKASAYYDTYAWAKVQGFSLEIQRYLLEELLERWPKHSIARHALDDVEEALRPKPLAPPPPTPAELKRAALREKIAAQQAEAAALRERVAQLEAARRAQAQVRRRRGRRARLARRRNAKAYIAPLFTLNRREPCE